MAHGNEMAFKFCSLSNARDILIITCDCKIGKIGLKLADYYSLFADVLHRTTIDDRSVW